MSYFDDSTIPEDERRNTSFQTATAIREAVTIAKRAQQPITYENALDVIYDLDPKVYETITKLLTEKNPSDLVKYYKELAEVRSDEKITIDPIELIEIDLGKAQIDLDKKPDKKFLQKRLFDLKAAREHFMPRIISEHKILNHDFYLRERIDLGATLIRENETFKDYTLPGKRVLRLRLLHPDVGESIIGTDLVYEQYDLITNKVRFVHLQYKRWDDSNVLYFSDARSVKQMHRLRDNLCNSGLCVGYQKNWNSSNYRFQYCSAFFRPTSKIATKDSKLASTGIHIPICKVLKLKEKDNKISKENTRDKAISSKIFEELFNSNLLGSRWLTFKELEDFYESKGLNNNTDTIRVLAQEVLIATEEEKENKRLDG